MYYIDENLTKTKAFKEQMDQHAEILFGDGSEAKSDRKRSRAGLGKIRQALGKLFQLPSLLFRQPDHPIAK